MAAQNAIRLPALEDALARNATVDELIALIPWDELAALKFELTDELQQTLLKAADVARRTPTWADLNAPLFDLTNPASLSWITNHAAELVELNIVEGGQEGIRAIIERSFVEGIPPREAAVLIRQYIGLLPRHAEAVAKRLIERGEKSSGAYARKLLNLRARTIARNETMTAANRGQWELWQAARRQGYLPEDEFERRWIVTPDDRLCPICAPLAGDRAPINGMFVKAGVANPPKHVQCRCSQRIIRKSNPNPTP